MTQRINILNVKLPNSQLKRSKLGMKNGIKVTLKLSLNVTGDSDDETDFPYKLLLTGREILWLCRNFANNSSTK